MNIYELTNKELTKNIKSFNRTAYGKVVFCLAYSIPLISVLALIIMTINMVRCRCAYYFFLVFLTTVVSFTTVSFVLGSIYYYQKLEKYISSRKKKE